MLQFYPRAYPACVSVLCMHVCLHVRAYVCVCVHCALSSSVDVLMQDHRNGMLSNSVALICGYLHMVCVCGCVCVCVCVCLCVCEYKLGMG